MIFIFFNVVFGLQTVEKAIKANCRYSYAVDSFSFDFLEKELGVQLKSQENQQNMPLYIDDDHVDKFYTIDESVVKEMISIVPNSLDIEGMLSKWIPIVAT